MTASIPGRSLALIAYAGWDGVERRIHTGVYAEAEESTVLYAYKKRTAKHPSMEIMIAVLLHKTNDSPWTDEELSPIARIAIRDIMPSGSALGASIVLATGEGHEVDFRDIDGYRSC